MKAIDQYIAALLEDHDCVIVPDFGGFIANYAPARINAVNHRFDPPHRKVSFNRFLVHNDGLLAAYIAQKEAESYAEALEHVKHYAVYLRNCIKTHKKVNIDKVGILFQHQDGTYHFEQVNNPAFFKEGTGLNAFFAQKLLREREAEKPDIALEKKDLKLEAKVIPLTTSPLIPVEEEQRNMAPETQEPIENVGTVPERKSKLKVLWPAAAALIGLPILGYALWLSLTSPLLYNGVKRFELGALNPFKGDSSIYQLRETSYQSGEWIKPEPLTWSNEEEHVVLQLENTPDKTIVVKLVNKAARKEVNASESLRYHVVGGCFSLKSNALNLVEQYQAKGNNAALIDEKGGLFRVSVRSFATRKEAKEYLTSLRNEIPGAWLLYK